MKKFLVENLDCATCAIKIENELRRTAGVESATLDFSTQLLHIQARNYEKIEEIVRSIEPSVELKNISASSGESRDMGKPFQARVELIRLLGFGLLFAVVLFLDYAGVVNVSEFAFGTIAVGVYLVSGYSVISAAIKTVLRKDFFDENVLMFIATMGAIAIGAYSEAIAVMVFYKTGEFFQNLSVYRSRRSIRALLAQKPAYANLKTDSGITKISPESARVGDIILVKPGEKIPLDGHVISGASMIDPSVLTGESVPKTIGTGDAVMAGEINMTGAVSIEVSRLYSESSIVKMLELVENASARKSPTENFITVFARYYTPAMVALAAAMAFLPPILMPGQTFEQWIYRALILLVISCPCALVISIPLGYFGGIGRASRSGILIKGSNYLDALARVKTVVFDKTGTLTEGVFHVKDVVANNGYTPNRVLTLAAMAQQHSNHPIARSIIEAYRKTGERIEPVSPDGHREISGMGVEIAFNNRTILVGNDRLMHQENIEHEACNIEGTIAHVAENGVYAGYILIGDKIKPQSAEAISSLRRNGVKQVIMLTGDNQCAAATIARRLDLDGFHASLLPEDKVRVFEKIQSENISGGKIAFVGDGINDAPVIARSDVGVAMGALGSDAAIETADVVLMTDSPAKMAEAVSIGRQTRVIVWQNIVLALSVKAIVILLGAFGLATMWAAVFADVGTTLLAVLNATRLLVKKEDKTVPENEETTGTHQYSTDTAGL